MKAWMPSRPDPRGAAPAPLGEVLVGAQNVIAQRSGAAIARPAWTAIMGPRIAGRTRVGGLHKGVLTIKVASSSWSNELSFLKSDLVHKLRHAGYEVTDLRFSVDKLQETPPPKWRGPRSPTIAQAPEKAPLPADLLERLMLVDDPNLRAAIAEAARHSLNRKK